VIIVILLTNIMFSSLSDSGPTWHVTAGVLYRTGTTSHNIISCTNRALIIQFKCSTIFSVVHQIHNGVIGTPCKSMCDTH